MENPLDPKPDSGSYVNLKERIFQEVQGTGINDQIFLSVQKAYENALSKEAIVLSRPERKRLFAQVLKLVLEDMLEKFEGRSGAA